MRLRDEILRGTNALGSGSVDYGASTSAPVSLIVNGAATTTTLSSSPNPSLFGQVVAFIAGVTAPQSTVIASGTVSFMDGMVPLGSGTLSASGVASFSLSSLSVGSHSITAQYGGSSSDNPSTSTMVIQVVQPAPVTVSLTAGPNPAAIGQPVTLSATVSSTNGIPVSGMIVFTDQFGTIGSAPFSGGQSSFTTTTLSSGSHSIVATYAANGGLGSAASNVYTEVIQSFDFSISLSPANPSIRSGSSASVGVELQGLGNLPGSIALTVGQAPQFSSLTLNPTTVQLYAGGKASAVLSITTVQLPQHAKLERLGPRLNHRNWIFFAGLIVPFSWCLGRKRSMGRFTVSAWAVILVCGLASLIGCTTIEYPVSRAAPGVYTIPLTGVDQASGISHTVVLRLTVSP